jgi:hypothetical protein
MPGIAPGTPVELWTWQGQPVYSASNRTLWVDATTGAPTPLYYPGGLPRNWTLAPQTVALFEGYPAKGSAVSLTATGIATGTRWYFSLDGTSYESETVHRTVFAARGPHALSVPALPVVVTGKTPDPKARRAPFAPATFNVSTNETFLTVAFVAQWSVSLLADPVGAGTIAPDPSWANASTPLRLTAVAAPGEVFLRWTGWGPGSSNASTASTAVKPLGPIRETAHFAPGYLVRFTEQGLLPGLNWTVSVRGALRSGPTGTLRFVEANGTYGYHVTEVPGYRALPQNGSFTVQGAPTTVPVSFIELRPPPPTFPVEFLETGLPNGTTWSVNVRNGSAISVRPTLVLMLANGSYGFSIQPVPGFQARPPSGGFFVHGGSVRVVLDFVPERTTFPTHFVALGLWSNVSWWAVIDGLRFAGTGAWISVLLQNGSHPFSIGASGGFGPDPREGVVPVDGTSTNVSIRFARPTAAVEISGRGLPLGVPWGFRLSDVVYQVAEAPVYLEEPNGTYSWDAEAPAGYHSSVTHGNLTVDLRATNLSISFVANGPGPRPAAGPLIRSAAWVGVVIAGLGAAAFLAVGAVHRRFSRRRMGRRNDPLG